LKIEKQNDERKVERSISRLAANSSIGLQKMLLLSE
jgi:hypothetical protein